MLLKKPPDFSFSGSQEEDFVANSCYGAEIGLAKRDITHPSFSTDVSSIESKSSIESIITLNVSKQNT